LKKVSEKKDHYLIDGNPYAITEHFPVIQNSKLLIVNIIPIKEEENNSMHTRSLLKQDKDH